MRVTVLDTEARRAGQRWHVRVTVEARYEGPAVKGFDRFADLVRAWQRSQHGTWRAVEPTDEDAASDVHLKVDLVSEMDAPVVFQPGQEIDVACRDELPTRRLRLVPGRSDREAIQ